MTKKGIYCIDQCYTENNLLSRESILFHPAETLKDYDKCNSIKDFWHWYHNEHLWEHFFYSLKCLQKTAIFRWKMIITIIIMITQGQNWNFFQFFFLYDIFQKVIKAFWQTDLLIDIKMCYYHFSAKYCCFLWTLQNVKKKNCRRCPL